MITPSLLGPLGLMELIFLLFLALTLAATAFWVWMLVDCATKEPNVGNDKLVWIIVIVATHALGAVIYYFVRRPQRITEHGK